MDFPDGLIVTGSVTASEGFFGTASYALAALTASYALNGGDGGVSSSYAETSSYAQVAQTALTASYFSGSALFENGLIVTGSVTASGGYFGTASYATTAATSSYTPNAIVTASAAASTITFTKGDGSTFNVEIAQSGSVESSSYATTAATATSASYATTASYANIAGKLDNIQFTTPSIVVSPSYVTITSGSQHLLNNTYVVSCTVNNSELTNYRLSGVVSWITASATVTTQDEVPVHRAGYTTASVFLRTFATSGSLPHLQLGSNLTLGTTQYTFTFTPTDN